MSKQLYRLRLDDYSAAAFTTFDKYYFGTLDMISEFINTLKADEDTSKKFHDLIAIHEEFVCGNKNVTHNVAYQESPYLVRTKVLGRDTSHLQKHSWEHLNTWRWIYDMHCDDATSEHIWISCRGEYFRCIKTTFANLQYQNTIGNFVPISSLWGHPGILKNEDIHLGNRLYVIEKRFPNKTSAMEDIESFKQTKDINFTQILNDIFGAG